MLTITRQQYNDAIEAGIAACPALTGAERFALRSLNPSHVRVGGFYDPTDLAAPRCPLSQVGVHHVVNDAGRYRMPDRAWPFAYAFDHAIRAPGAGPIGGEVFEVV